LKAIITDIEQSTLNYLTLQNKSLLKITSTVILSNWLQRVFMWQTYASNIVIINVQDVEYCMTADIWIAENRSIIASVLHVINFVSYH